MATNNIKLTIDGKEITTPAGQTILAVCRENGIDIPTLCYDPRVPAYGSCLVCVVEVEGRKNLALSCTTEAQDGMVVFSQNEKVFNARKNALEMLASNHFADCRGDCYQACPANIDVQAYLAQAKAGEHKAALETIRETNPFPMVCGRVCVRYCEGACRRKDIDNPVAINFVKRYASDLENDNLEKPTVAPANGKKVAIVGGGPAGMSAAFYLAKKGYGTKVFEMHDKLGGMLRWGIPDYRLPQEVLDKELQYIIDHGVEVQTHSKLGRDFSLDELKKQGFDAIFLAMGAQKAKKMRVKNEEADGVLSGIGYLEDVKKKGAPKMSGTVLIVGGGNTAIDAARTALRCNADEVRILYRRTRKEMPADEIEVEDALEEGVIIDFLVAPQEVITENGKLKSLRCQKMELGEPDASGRRRPVPVEGSDYDIDCTCIISAIGQDCDLTGIENETLGEIEVTKWDTIVADEKTFATNIEGVFSGGDVATGPAAAIDAIGAGHKVATVIDRYLQKGAILPAWKEFVSKTASLGELPASYWTQFAKMERSKMRQTNAGTRGSTFDEVDHGITAGDVPHETARCLSCGCSDVETCQLKEYCSEYDVDQKHYAGSVKKYDVDQTHPYLELDPNKCILCGRCVRTCDDLVGATALGYVNRGYDMIVRPALGRHLHETTCVSCGNCIDACPTGAITFRNPLEQPMFPANQHKSICNFCGVGCELVVNKSNNSFWNVTAKETKPYHGGETCLRGRFLHRALMSDNRLTEVIVDMKSSDLTTGIKTATAELKKIADSTGPESLAVFVSPKATNEEIYLAQRLARQGFNTNNVASLYDLNHADDSDDLYHSLGTVATTTQDSTLENTDVILVMNAHPQKENPVLNFRLKRAAKRGAKLYTMSSAETDLSSFATSWLHSKKGSNTAILNAVIYELLKNKLYDNDFVRNRIDGFDDLSQQEKMTWSQAAEISGVGPDKLQELFADISDLNKSLVVVYNKDSVTEKSAGDLQAAVNILALTGRISKSGSGLLLSREHSNSQGHHDFAANPQAVEENSRLAGFCSDIKGARSLTELREMLLGGKIKGIITIGEDFSIDPSFEKAFSQADYTVCIDSHKSGTSENAKVAIPSAVYLETNGSVTSQDRKVTKFNAVFDSPAKTNGHQVLAALLKEAAKTDLSSLEEVRKEMVDMQPLYSDWLQNENGQSYYWGKDLLKNEFYTSTKKAKLKPADDTVAVSSTARACFSPIDKVMLEEKGKLQQL
jgi:formate dehydrogenase major subunit